MPDVDLIILGSRSPRRRELLEPIVGSASLRVMPPLSSEEAGFDDVHDDASIKQRLQEIVRQKIAAVCQQVDKADSSVLNPKERPHPARQDGAGVGELKPSRGERSFSIAPSPSATGNTRHAPIIVVADTIVIASNDAGIKQVLGQPESDQWRSQVRDWLRFWLAGRTHEVWTGVIVARNTDCREFVVKSKVTFCEISDATIDWYLSVSESLGKAGGYAIQGHAAAFVSQLSGSLSNVIGLPLMEVMAAMESLGWRLPGDQPKDAG